MEHGQPEWVIDDKYDELVYRGLALARVWPDPEGGVFVRTRCYIEGFSPTRRMATTTGARRYIEAWLKRWGADAIREVNNKVESARIAAEYRASLPKDEIQPDPRKPRRGRKAW